jgi:hypothetical protein
MAGAVAEAGAAEKAAEGLVWGWKTATVEAMNCRSSSLNSISIIEADTRDFS